MKTTDEIGTFTSSAFPTKFIEKIEALEGDHVRTKGNRAAWPGFDAKEFAF